jgi:hypothetical protein
MLPPANGLIKAPVMEMPFTCDRTHACMMPDDVRQAVSDHIGHCEATCRDVTYQALQKSGPVELLDYHVVVRIFFAPSLV